MTNDDQRRLRLLLKKYLADEQSQEEYSELAELMLGYNAEELTSLLEELLPDEQFRKRSSEDLSWQASLLRTVKERRPVYRLPVFRALRKAGTSSRYKIRTSYAAAAVALITIGISAWLLLRPARQEWASTDPCGLKVPSKKDGVIRIDMTHDKITFSVPRSWQYNLTLPDGSKVLLNAASSISYPRSFTGSSREVAIEGEVYFNVQSDSTKPFYVTSRGKRMEAPGSYFNVNAYEEDVILTLAPAGASWREGYFAFKQAEIKEVISEMARWYDWQVSFGSRVNPVKISATFCRNTPESGALEELRQQGIAFRKRGNQITIDN